VRLEEDCSRMDNFAIAKGSGLGYIRYSLVFVRWAFQEELFLTE
jgi:hypothetical protein